MRLVCANEKVSGRYRRLEDGCKQTYTLAIIERDYQKQKEKTQWTRTMKYFNEIPLHKLTHTTDRLMNNY